MTTIITAILRLSLTLLVCTLYVLPPVVYAQNPDPVMSAGSTGGAGGAGGGGTVTSVEGGVGIDCINNTTDVECSPDRTVIGFKGSSAGTPTMAGKLTGDVEVDTSASPERFYFCGADDGTDCTAAIRLASFSEITEGLADPGSNGVVKRTALNTTDVAGHADITALYGGGSCSGYLKSDGTCDTPAGGGGSCPVVPLPYEGAHLISNAAGNTMATDAAVYIADVFIPCDIAVNTIQARIGTGDSGSSLKIGIYSADGNTLHTSVSLSTTSGSVNVSGAASGAPVTITQGRYRLAYSIDDDDNDSPTTAQCVAIPGINSIADATSKLVGVAANALSGGNLPSTTGAITWTTQEAPCLVVLIN